MQKVISTDLAPKAVGPYSQAIAVQGKTMVFISGQIPLDPATMVIESSDVVLQTRTVLMNLKAILDEASLKPSCIVKTTVYLKSMDDFALMNREYEKFFEGHRPARACFEVSRLPKDALVEIDAIAVC